MMRQTLARVTGRRWDGWSGSDSCCAVGEARGTATSLQPNALVSDIGMPGAHALIRQVRVLSLQEDGFRLWR